MTRAGRNLLRIVRAMNNQGNKIMQGPGDMSQKRKLLAPVLAKAQQLMNKKATVNYKTKTLENKVYKDLGDHAYIDAMERYGPIESEYDGVGYDNKFDTFYIKRRNAFIEKANKVLDKYRREAEYTDKRVGKLETNHEKKRSAAGTVGGTLGIPAGAAASTYVLRKHMPAKSKLGSALLTALIMGSAVAGGVGGAYAGIKSADKFHNKKYGPELERIKSRSNQIADEAVDYALGIRKKATCAADIPGTADYIRAKIKKRAAMIKRS